MMNSLDPVKQVVDGTSQGRSHSEDTQEYTIVKKHIHYIRPNYI
jgi:hypothetical protein